MIVFISGGYSRKAVLGVQTDGSGLTQISHPDGDHVATSPQWWPDGAKLAFISDADGNDDIYIVNPDGSELTQLTITQRHDSPGVWDMAWSPDGTELAYGVGPYGVRRIHIISTDGTETAQVPDVE